MLMNYSSYFLGKVLLENTVTEGKSKNFRKPVLRGKERAKHKKQYYVIIYLTEMSLAVNH